MGQSKLIYINKLADMITLHMSTEDIERIKSSLHLERVQKVQKEYTIDSDGFSRMHWVYRGYRNTNLDIPPMSHVVYTLQKEEYEAWRRVFDRIHELLDYEGKLHKISSEEYTAWAEVLYRGNKPTSSSYR